MVYFPHSGVVSLLAVMEAGNAVESATIGSEGAVNVMVGLGARRAAGRAVVQVGGTASQILAPRFSDVVHDSPAVHSIIVHYNDMQAGLVYQAVGCNATHRVEARLCRLLLQTRDRIENDSLPLTHGGLSEMLGVRRTTVTLLALQFQD
jgi:CRP-like cAMP-binding protein